MERVATHSALEGLDPPIILFANHEGEEMGDCEACLDRGLARDVRFRAPLAPELLIVPDVSPTVAAAHDSGRTEALWTMSFSPRIRSSMHLPALSTSRSTTEFGICLLIQAQLERRSPGRPAMQIGSEKLQSVPRGSGTCRTSPDGARDGARGG